MTKIKRRTKRLLRKLLVLAGVAVVMGAALCFTYPAVEHVFQPYSYNYYKYRPTQEVVSSVDVSGLSPAKAVPILMYHGVVQNEDLENTQLSNFIAEMEMLKKEGYQTISLEELESFLNGQYVLPPKPVIITFDDGRKDSYYPTDDILKKLGFRATIFVATGKTNKQDKFFLSWDELKIMKDSGRWDIQAHGTDAHGLIEVDSEKTKGRFLTSRKYVNGKGLETVEEFNQRVEQDYLQNINDIKNHLGIAAKYYAIPLNDYGEENPSNYPDAYALNNELVKKYFSMAFVEVFVYDEEGGTFPKKGLQTFNFQDASPYRIARIEVKNMEASDLKRLLEEGEPKQAKMRIGKSDPVAFEEATELLFGSMKFTADGLHLMASKDSPSARAVFGFQSWNNYSVEARIRRLRGRSVVLQAYVSDNNNYISFGLTDNGVFLRETVDGVEKEMGSSMFSEGSMLKGATLKLVMKDRRIGAYINGKMVFNLVPISLRRGAVGFKVWDDKGNGESILEVLTVVPTML